MPISVTLVAIISIVGGLSFAAYMAHIRVKMKANEAKIDSDTQQQIDLLQSRIEVLEKIVTEDGYDLKKEIDSLKKAG